MAFLLTSKNVLAYLVECGLCSHEETQRSRVERCEGKNFNLLIRLEGGRELIVKQERHDQEGRAAGEFINEWRSQQFMEKFSDISLLQECLPRVLHFNAQHSIVVFQYLRDYGDLLHFYHREDVFPSVIACSLGEILATIHRATFGNQQYQEFFRGSAGDASGAVATRLIPPVGRIGPEIFGMVPVDGLKFFSLYQRYSSLGQAAAELIEAFSPGCFTHNDLKLNNVLLHTDRAQGGDVSIRLIDWERSGWGDPAFDLGTVIGGYLQMWLSSLVVSKTLSIEESLRLAAIPLERVQPSMAALAGTYLDVFPGILEHRPDFLQRVVQFAGFALIQQIQAMIQYQKQFSNTGICMLQVGKSLLCRPESSLGVIFGDSLSERFRCERSAA